MDKASEWLLSHSSSIQSKRAKRSSGESRQTFKVSITGGKGGVGKTSVALKTAQELSNMGYKVLLIDCDSNLSNTAIKLGLPLDQKFWKLLSAELSFDECLIKKGDFHLLPACNGSVDLFETKLNFDEVMIDIISAHEDEYDFILLDCPAGLSKESLTLSAYCDYRWIVVTPDKSSITDSYSLVKILNTKYGVKENHLLVNMYSTDRQFQKVVITLSETIENFLNARTNILGGIKKFDVANDEFDTFFLSPSSSEWHKNFLKMIFGFTDKLVSPEADFNRALGFEQEVH
jgi:flagellar biosynthesis protein FlhG